MKNLILTILFLLVWIEVFAQTPQWELSRDSIEIDGIYRSFQYFAPIDFREAPSLVFVLHGSNGSASRARNLTGFEFEKIANERKSFIVVYPEGYQQHWNDCRKTASYQANKKDVNDIAFFSTMIQYFIEKFEIDRDAVFATGLSNGGHMCYKLAYELPDKIRGIAPFAANIPVEANNDCSPKNTAVSVLIINGTADPLNPHEGGWVVVGQDSTRGIVYSTEKSLDYWKNMLPCKPSLEIVEYENTIPNDSSTLEHYKYFCKDSKMKVELLKVINGGHSVPLINAPKLSTRWKAILGNTNNDINSPLLVLDFFENLK